MAEVLLLDRPQLELERDPDTQWAFQAFDQLADLYDEDIFCDVDQTLYVGRTCVLEVFPDLDTSVGTVRPGAAELLKALTDNGNRVHLWSRGSREHAQGMAKIFGLDHLVTGYHRKAIITLEDGGLRAVKDVTAADVIRETGLLPAATIDNEAGDQIVDAPEVRFVKVPDMIPLATQELELQPQ